MPQCPYCKRDFDRLTDDHIFPEYLGGSRSIPACFDCNSGFGGGFEGRTSQMLGPVLMSYHMAGIQFRVRPQPIKEIIAENGMSYRLEATDDGAVRRFAKPMIERGSDGTFKS